MHDCFYYNYLACTNRTRQMYPAPINFLRLDDGSEFVKGSSFMELIEILPPCWVHGGKNMKKNCLFL